MSDFIIQTKDLEKIYGDKAKTHALKKLNLNIPKGSFSCIVGPSGHGKSTALQIIGGLDRPTSGQVLVDDVDISALNDNELAQIRGQKIGFVFQFFNLLENLNALENIQMAMMFTKTGSKASKKRALELLELVGLADKAGAKPNELSGGQLQRIAIARALANEPDILLMDEPTGNLDSQSEKEIMECILQIHKSGKTVVIVTHSTDIAAQAELLFEIRDGQLYKP